MNDRNQYDEDAAISEDLNESHFSKCCNYRIIFNNATGDYVCSGCRARAGNWKKVSWFEISLEVNKNKKYYIKGIGGPYTLVNASKRIMKNVKGNEFMHYAEDFYVKED